MASENSDPFAPAKDTLRDTIKWLAVALGALATALIAGLSLKDLSDVNTNHLILAMIGLIVSIFSIFIMMGIFVWLLLPKKFSLTQLEIDSDLKDRIQKSAPDLLPPGYSNLNSVLKEYRENIERIGDNKLDQENQAYTEAKKFVLSSGPIIRRIISYAHFDIMVRNLRKCGILIFPLAFITLAGIFIFSYFSGAGDKSGPMSRGEVLPVEFVPGKEWIDLAKALSGACGDTASQRAQVIGTPRPGWVELMLLAPEACAGISISVPAHITAAPTAPLRTATPAAP